MHHYTTLWLATLGLYDIALTNCKIQPWVSEADLPVLPCAHLVHGTIGVVVEQSKLCPIRKNSALLCVIVMDKCLTGSECYPHPPIPVILVVRKVQHYFVTETPVGVQRK
mmetsp:Transcript_12531/g.19305  ORF Transcript_12531/g.19305 Transcript_12531/m.19305 type:complete len:110 (+) Transcript_12531:354-683(+)